MLKNVTPNIAQPGGGRGHKDVLLVVPNALSCCVIFLRLAIITSAMKPVIAMARKENGQPGNCPMRSHCVANKGVACQEISAGGNPTGHASTNQRQWLSRKPAPSSCRTNITRPDSISVSRSIRCQIKPTNGEIIARAKP